MNTTLHKIIPWKVTWKRTLLESGIFLGAYILWLVFRPPEASSRGLIGSLAVVAPLAAAILLILWAQPLIEKSNKRAWLFCGLALTCWLIGDLIRTYYLALRNVPMPTTTIADGINFLAYPFMLLALIFYPSRERYLPSRFRFLFDAIISSVVMLALGWLVIARPAYQTNSADILNLLPLAYPVADLVLLMILINTMLANPLSRRSLILWGIGLLGFLVSDYVFSYQVLIQDYRAGGVESLGWTAGGLLFGLSVIVETTTKKDAYKTETTPDAGARLQNVLPIVLVLVLIWFVLSDWRLRGEPSVFGLWLAIVMGLSLIVRLGVRAGEAELNRYWQLFSGLVEPTFICDANGHVIVANPALIKILGLERGIKISRLNLLAIIEDHKGLQKFIDRAVHEAISREVKFNGSNNPYLLSLSPIFSENKKTLIAGIAYDLTDQKQHQETLQKINKDLRAMSRRLENLNAQLEEKVDERTQTIKDAYRQMEEQNKMLQTYDKLKSDFVSMVSHELRTPLTSLFGGIELLLARPSRKPEDKEALNLMKSEVQRLIHFVENVLNLSVIEAGRLDAHIEPIDLTLVVQDVLRSMDNIPGATRIRSNFPSTLPPVLADEGFIHSILIQLLDNALKYADPSPVIIDVRQYHQKLRVRVTDEGPGIPVEKRKLLFRRFQRLNVTDSQSIYGYGLGLYMSKQLLKSLHSDLRYEMPSRGGARFYFDLEVAK